MERPLSLDGQPWRSSNKRKLHFFHKLSQEIGSTCTCPLAGRDTTRARQGTGYPGPPCSPELLRLLSDHQRGDGTRDQLNQPVDKPPPRDGNCPQLKKTRREDTTFSSSSSPQPTEGQASQRHHLSRGRIFSRPASPWQAAAVAQAQRRFRALFLTTHDAVRHRPVAKAAFRRRVSA